MHDIVILSGARTAIGTFGGSLAGTAPGALGALVAREALARAGGVEGGQIGHVTFGHIINTEPRDMYLSRVAAMEAGIPPDTTPAMNVNRLCGSGVQAIISAVQNLALGGDADFALAGGGAENMSRSPYILPAARWGGQKMGDAGGAQDMMLGALNCPPFGTGHMGGITAENVSAEHDVSVKIRMPSPWKANAGLRRPSRRGGISRIRSCRLR